MEKNIRKIVTFIDKTLVEGEKEVENPWIIATAAAVIHDEYASEFQEDLSPLIDTYSNYLSEVLSSEIEKATGWDLKDTEGVGKAAVVGLNVEVEHGCAIAHNLKFGTPVRNKMKGLEGLVSSEYRTGPGGSIIVPLKHKDDHKLRAHHMSVMFSIPDAPRQDEIVIALSISNTGRPFARIGSPSTDSV
ncbi:amino acid synthesis family protein [Virgibacillus byunsanensis]|uniref:Amino acid synthesis family protein n=1 Tax=Virgibacillus byunsanensis TaxID=570945 RepID=A0ABW3LG60_9BACI